MSDEVMPADLATIFDEMNAECRRQRQLWGIQTHPDGTGSSSWRSALDFARSRFDTARSEDRLTWLEILDEEVCEVFAETDVSRIREELVQVGAVVASWIRAIDERRQPKPVGRLYGD